MSDPDLHYDLIVIGTGAGGGTLAYRLASTGKRILLLERGGFLPSSSAVNPALTIVANALRVGDHLAKRLG